MGGKKSGSRKNGLAHKARRSGRSGSGASSKKRPGTAKTGGRTRKASFYVLSAAVLLIAGYFLWPVAFSGRPAPASADVIDIAANMSGFSQRVIRIRAGEPVTIRLTSLDGPYHRDGGGKHQFAVDELDVNIVAPPKGSASQTFTPTEPGTYVFYCDICCGGRANPTMSGRLQVMG